MIEDDFMWNKAFERLLVLDGKPISECTVKELGEREVLLDEVFPDLARRYRAQQAEIAQLRMRIKAVEMEGNPHYFELFNLREENEQLKKLLYKALHPVNTF